jgi:hypothetical protein
MCLRETHVIAAHDTTRGSKLICNGFNREVSDTLDTCTNREETVSEIQAEQPMCFFLDKTSGQRLGGGGFVSADPTAPEHPPPRLC